MSEVDEFLADLEARPAVKIPIPLPGTPLFDERVSLDGTDYILRFDWHDREQRWYFDVLDASGVMITAGIKLVSHWPVYRRETLPNSPKGEFMVSAPDLLPPALADFGLRSFLLYFPPADPEVDTSGIVTP